MKNTNSPELTDELMRQLNELNEKNAVIEEGNGVLIDKIKELNELNQALAESYSKLQVEFGYAKAENNDLLKQIKELNQKQQWISVKERKPDFNVSVLVFIPEEDDHITTGMWDISKKWVLLDEYRVPRSEVTYWSAMVSMPEDKSYTKSPYRPTEEDTITYQIRALQKNIFELESSNSLLQKELDELKVMRFDKIEGIVAENTRLREALTEMLALHEALNKGHKSKQYYSAFELLKKHQ